MWKFYAAATGAVLFPVLISFGQVTLLSQSRVANGVASINFILQQPVGVTDSFSDSTMDPGPYTLSDAASVTSVPVTTSVSVEHTSLISPSEISFHSTLTGSHTRLPSQSDVTGSGTHSFLSRFRVDAPVEYVLSGSVFHGAPQGATDVTFMGNGMFFFASSSGSPTFSSSGILQPGEYQFQATSISFSFEDFSGDPRSYSSMFTGSITFVPAPGAACLLVLGIGALSRRRR